MTANDIVWIAAGSAFSGFLAGIAASIAVIYGL